MLSFARSGAPLACGFVLLLLSRAAASPIPKPSGRPASQDNLAVLRGCVNGSSLTNVVEADGERATSPVYRMTGSKTILDRIRKEHNGHQIEVTGALRDGDDPSTGVRKTKKIGKGRLMVGARQGTPEQLRTPVTTPEIHVAEFRHVAKSCGQ